MPQSPWCQNTTLTLLTAPPGWGKTSLLLDLLPTLDRAIVFISPLKALSLEFHARLQGEGVASHLVGGRRELTGKFHRLLRYQVLVLSYEHVTEEFAQYLEKHSERFLLVFDEFHLLFYWGSSFRPALWESFYRLAETGSAVLALSGTVSEGILSELKATFLNSFRTILLIDRGNFQLLNWPQKIYYLSREEELWIHLQRRLEQGRRCLVFLPFREQVEQWARRLRSWDWAVLSCVGGKTVQFREQLEAAKEVQVILATDALGHGVNLPAIEEVLIAYRVSERAMWLQMVGRGGRDGRAYRLYCMNTHGASWVKNTAARVRNAMSVFFSWQRIPLCTWAILILSMGLD